MKPKTRREVLAMAAMGALLRRDAAAQQSAPSIVYRDYSRCLPDYLRDLAERAYQSRNRAIAGLTTPEAIRDRQKWVRESVLEPGRRRPERLSAQRPYGRLRSNERAIVSKGGLREPAELPHFRKPGTPTVGQPPFPGVLYQMGHTTNGKGDATYQLCCQTLAGLGYLVLGFDPMGQGERTYYPGRTPSRSRLGADEEHTFPARQMLLKGIRGRRLPWRPSGAARCTLPSTRPPCTRVPDPRRSACCRSGSSRHFLRASCRRSVAPLRVQPKAPLNRYWR